MMTEDLFIFLSMKDDYLAEKKLDYRGYAATKLVGFSTKQKDGRVFSGQEFITINMFNATPGIWRISLTGVYIYKGVYI